MAGIDIRFRFRNWCGSLVGAWLALFLTTVAAQAADGGDANDLVLIRSGTLPILLTVPHGGRDAIPGVPERDAARPRRKTGQWADFNKGSDTDSDALALRIAAAIEVATGGKPYLVAAKFRRAFIDANRPADVAYDSDEAGHVYTRYHAAIRRFVDELRERFPAAILIDVHGQHKDPDVVMRGTLNGKSVARLIRRAGQDAMTGPRGLFGQLEAHGLGVFPRNDVPLRGTAENAGFNGGYTVAIYGSDRPDGIDAVQLEVGTRYRRRAALDESGQAIGRAIAAFHAAYLKDGGEAGRR